MTWEVIVGILFVGVLVFVRVLVLLVDKPWISDYGYNPWDGKGNLKK